LYFYKKIINLKIENKNTIIQIQFIQIKMNMNGLNIYYEINYDTYVKMIQDIFDNNLDPNNYLNCKFTPLIYSIKYQDYPTFNKFIKLGANFNDCNALHHAINVDDMILIEVLLFNGINPNTHLNGYTPLHMAIENHRSKILNMLLDYGADVTIPNFGGGITPLHLIIRNNYYNDFCGIKYNDLFDKFVKNAPENWVHNVNCGTLIHKAIQEENDYIFDYLINQKVDINIKDRFGRTPFFCAVERNNMRMIKILFNDKININDIDRRQSHSMLYLAVNYNNIELISQFLKMGANPNIQDKYGDTPLHLAIKKNDIPVINTGLSAHTVTSINKLSSSQLININNHNNEIIELLLKYKADPSIQNNDGNTILHNIIRYASLNERKIELIKLFMSHGADINMQNKKGEAILHYALDLSYEVVELLLQCKANPNIKCNDGYTPLHVITWKNRNNEKDVIHIIELFLKYNADINIQDKYGDTSLDYAIKNNNKKIIELLTYNKNK